MANVSGIGSNGAAGATDSNSLPAAAGKAAATDSLGNTQTFLQLLVAQLKNQDPTQPVDGTQFVTQLAQFSNLEQSVAMRQDIGAIRTKFVGASTDSSSSSPAVSGS